MEQSSPENKNQATEENFEDQPQQPADQVDEKMEKQEEVDQHEQTMAKLLEEYLTLIEEDDQDRDRDQLIQLELDTKGHLMDDEGKVKSMEQIVKRKIQYREELIAKYSDLKHRIQEEDLKKSESIVKEIHSRQKKRFDELKQLQNTMEKIDTHKQTLSTLKLESIKLMSKSAFQFSEMSKSQSGFNLDQLNFERDEMKKERKQKFDKLITRQLMIQSKRLEDEDKHQRFRFETELKQKNAEDNVEQQRIWQLDVMQKTSKQREDQFKSQQLIQSKKNSDYVDKLVLKQQTKEQQLEMIRNYQLEYQAYLKQMNVDKSKGNEQKKEMARKRKLDEIEEQRILTEQKAQKDEEKVQHIENFRMMRQEFLKKQGEDEQLKTQQILNRGKEQVEEKNRKAHEKWAKQAQYKQVFDGFYNTHYQLVQQEHQSKWLKIIHDKQQKDNIKEEQIQKNFISRVKSQELISKQLERYKREEIESLVGKQVLRHIQFEERKNYLEQVQEQKHLQIMMKRKEQDFKLKFFEEEKKKVLQEREQIDKYLEQERKKIDQAVSSSQKFGNTTSSLKNFSHVVQ